MLKQSSPSLNPHPKGICSPGFLGWGLICEKTAQAVIFCLFVHLQAGSEGGNDLGAYTVTVKPKRPSKPDLGSLLTSGLSVSGRT